MLKYDHKRRTWGATSAFLADYGDFISPFTAYSTSREEALEGIAAFERGELKYQPTELRLSRALGAA